MLIILIICYDSWLPHLWTVFNPYFFLCVLQGFLYCSAAKTLLCFPLLSLLMIMVPALTVCFLLQTWQLLYSSVLIPYCPSLTNSVHTLSAQKGNACSLLSTVDNHLFSFPFIFLVHNEAGSESCGKTSDFSKILTQPPLSSLLCTSYFAWSSWSLKMNDKSTTKPLCFHFVQLIDSPAFLS